ncbi:MAG: bi-domain-containing oxidoreductase [Anaerolineales bacterium]|nr:bi-domain-containing oxidoreductase [Anaerolineales bacterium]
MKQVLQNIRNGETYVAEVPIPTVKPGTALVKTAVSLVSAGTERMVVEFAEKSLIGKASSRPDLVRQVLDKARREGLLTTIEATFNRLDQPMVLGYSSAGEIITLGEGLNNYRVGQRVACAGGGYAVHAEYAVVPQNLMAAIPDQVSYEHAAFTTLGAIAMHGFRLTRVQVGEYIAIIGLGLVGLLAAGIAKASGCLVLGIDIDPRRIELATQMGIEGVLRENAENIASGFTRNRGCDAVLICADTPSNDPVELAGVIARDRANIVATGAVGLNIPRKIYYEKELSFINSRSYGPGRYDKNYEESGHDYPIGYVRWTEGRNLEAFLDLMSNDQIHLEPLISHRIPIEQAPQAYDLIAGKKQEPFLGVLLTYPMTAPGENLSKRIVFPQKAVPTKPSSSQVSVGVLGAGNFASAVMLPALSKIPNIRLTGIASASGVNAHSAAKCFGFSYAASDEKEVIEDPRTQVIAILTRHNLHSRQVIAALQAGKSVFCEKPLAINPQELDDIEKTLNDIHNGEYESNSQNPPPILMVGFNRRFAPLAVKMAGFFTHHREPIFAHYRVNAGYIPLSHWVHDPTQGGGRIIGEGCHFIDFLTFLVGSPPVDVHAQALPDIGKYAQDNVAITLSYADGSICTMDYLANGDKSFAKEYVEVFCGGQVAVLDDFRKLILIKNGKRQIAQSYLRQDKGHRSEWEVFINALQNQSKPPIPYDQIFGVTRASFKAAQALKGK